MKKNLLLLGIVFGIAIFAWQYSNHYFRIEQKANEILAQNNLDKNYFLKCQEQADALLLRTKIDQNQIKSLNDRLTLTKQKLQDLNKSSNTKYSELYAKWRACVPTITWVSNNCFTFNDRTRKGLFCETG